MQTINLTSVNVDEAEYVVLDFETTGIAPSRSRVIEIGMVKIRGTKIIDSFSRLINPEVPIPPVITNITGITNEDVEDAPTFEEIIRNISDFIGESLIVAHNISFDSGFLKHEFLRAGFDPLPNPTVCTLTLSRKLFPELKSKKLGNVANYLRIIHKNVHRALGDANVTAKIFLRLLERLKDEHEVETVNDLLAFQGYPQTKRFVMIKKKLASDLHSLPNEPGVYFFHNAKGEIIYIGKAKSLANRVRNYFYFNASAKAKKIVRQASRISFQITNSELSALIAETELIKFHNPEFNVLQKRYPSSYFICVVKNTPFPYLKVTSRFAFDGNDYFGPYPNRETAKALLEIANKSSGIRECKDKEFKKGKKCYLYDIGRCLAPCEFPDTKQQYEEELKNVYEFLSGNNQKALDSLLKKMQTLSAQQKFEEAGEVRDLINLLLKQINRTSLIKGQINSATVLIKIHSAGKTDFVLLIKGKTFIKDFPLDAPCAFQKALEGYFEGDIQLFNELTEKDLERLKITLTWLSRNRSKVTVKDLSEANNYREVLNSGFLNEQRISLQT